MTTIPLFPEFRRLEVGDRAVIEAITRHHPPYSDFGFTSLWSWDTDGMCAISMLGGNLVVRFKDFTSDAHFYSFIGQDAVTEAVEILLAHAHQESLPAQLKLVPEAVVAADNRLSRFFSVEEDRDNFDYIYAVDNWARFPAPDFQEHQKKAERCRSKAMLDFRILDSGDPACQAAMCDLFHRWAQQKQSCVLEDLQHEFAALQRLFALTDSDRIVASGWYHGDLLVGWSIWEALPGGEYVVGHFQKADRAFRGLSSLQAHTLGQFLAREGRRLINGEQDLGIPGLRAHKMSLQPRTFLRKFIITGQGA